MPCIHYQSSDTITEAFAATLPIAPQTVTQGMNQGSIHSPEKPTTFMDVITKSVKSPNSRHAF